MIATFLKQ